MSTRRRSARQAGHRRRSLYTDPDTDDDFDLSDDIDAGDGSYESPVANPVKRRRTEFTRQSGVISNAARRPSIEHIARTRSSARQQRAQPTVGDRAVERVTALVSRRHGGLSRKRRHHRSQQSPSKINITKQASDTTNDIPSDGVKPPWTTLPYEVLLQIFSFAYDSEPGSKKWLVRSSYKICSAFTEPALAAFYHTPHLPTSSHIECLHKLVQAPKAQRSINYGVKVKRLEIDINAFVSHKDTTDHFEFVDLVSRLPQLEEIFITSMQDKPPYRRHVMPRWKYSAAWLSALIVTGVRLRGWRWNWLFVRQGIGAPRLYDHMLQAHSSTAFSSLRHLEIGDHPEFVTSDDTSSHQEDMIADMIAQLPSLESLELETCDIVHTRFLEHLPRNLQSLRLANCEALTSDALSAFLAHDGGCNLQQLILDHNVRLDLGFLPQLGFNCHKLRRLSMDLHCYSQHHTVNDAEPRYKQALHEDQLPTWPSSLESLELSHVQKLTATAGQNLFASLLDSADRLPRLRSIMIAAHISISWRDRVSFRSTWIDQMRRVFLRRSPLPDPALASLKAFRIAKSAAPYPTAQSSEQGRVMVGVQLSEPDVDLSEYSEQSAGDSQGHNRKRRSGRIAASETERATRQAREAEQRRIALLNIDQDQDESDGSDEAKPKFVQGMCHTVDIRIDNLRPREEQLNESHFLDSEESGDEDWSETGEAQEETYAW